MSRAGVAWVEFRGDTSRLQNDVRKEFRSAGFKRLGQEAGDELADGLLTGDRAFGRLGKSAEGAEKKTEGFRTKTGLLAGALRTAASGLDSFSRGLDDTDRSLTKTSASANRSSTSIISLDKVIGKSNRNLSFLQRSIKLLKWPAIITGAGFAAQAITTLTAGVVGLVSALAPLSGALVAYPALLGSMGQAAGVFALAGVKDLTAALGGNAEALNRLTPAGQRFLRTLQAYKPRLDALKASVQRPLFGPLEKGLKAAMANFPIFRTEITRTASVMGQLGRRAGELVGSRGFGRDMGTIMRGNTRLIDNLGQAGLHLSNAFRHIMVEAQPLIAWMGRGINRFTQLFEAQMKAARASGALTGFFAQTRQVMSQLGGLTSNLASGFLQIGKAAAPMGQRILDSLTKASEGFKTWSQSTQGKNAMADYFKRAEGPLRELGLLTRDIGKSLLELGATPGLQKLINTVRVDLVPALTDMVKVTTEAFGPTLVETLSSVVVLMTDLAGAAGPLTITVQGIGLLADGLHALFETVPGTKTAVVTISSLFGVISAVGLASAVSNFAGFSKGLEVLGLKSKGAKGRVSLLSKAMTGLKGAAVSTFTALKSGAIWTAITTGAGRAKSAVIGLMTAMRGSAAVTALVTALGRLRAAMMVTSAFMFGPWGLAIAAVIAGAVLIATHWSQTKAVLSTVWNAIKTAAGAVFKAIGWAARNGLLGPVPFIISRWREVKGILGSVWGGIKNAAQTVFKATGWAARNGLLGPIGLIISRWREVKGVATAVWGGVHDAVVGAAKRISDALQWIIDKVNKVIDAFGAAGGALKDAGDFLTPGDEGGFFGIGAQTGGVVHRDAIKARTGVIVPGRGSGDKVPALLEPGEVVWNREAVKGMGGPQKANQANQIFPRFQRGGFLSEMTRSAIGIGMAAGNVHIARTLGPAPKMVEAGKSQIGGPYVYGGGHGGFALRNVDCSGLVSGLLHVGGLLNGAPMTTDGLKGWGQSGEGRVITVGVRGTSGRNAHTMMKIGRWFFESGSGHGAQEVSGWSGSFPIKRHPEGLQRGGIVNPLMDPESPMFVGWGLQSGGVAAKRKALDRRRFPQGDLAGLASYVGAANPTLMGQIAMAESQGNRFARGDAGERSFWQIMAFWGGGDKLFESLYQARKMKYIQEKQGLGAWTTYKAGLHNDYPATGPSGSFLKLLQTGTTAGPKGKRGKGKRKGKDAGNWPGVPLKLSKSIDQLSSASDLYDEYAQRAEQLGGMVFGGNEIAWLTQELTTLFELRNQLVHAYLYLVARIEDLNEKIAKADSKQLGGIVGMAGGGAAKKGRKKAGGKAGKAGQAMKKKVKDWTARRDQMSETLGNVSSTLSDVQGATGGTSLLSALPPTGELGGRIFTVQMALREATGSDPSITSGISADVLKEISYLRDLGVMFNPGQFAGFFARGGLLGAGTWGIAGERGPEPVVGPARVIPNAGETTIRVVLEDNRTRVYQDDQLIRDVVHEEMDERDRSDRGHFRAGAKAR